MFSRTNRSYLSRRSSFNPRPVNLLQPLLRSQKSQLLCNQANPASFCKSPGWGVPTREFVRCTEAQKCPFVSPLVATLTHSLSRKSFPCHSYRNTRDGGVTVASVSASMSLCRRLPLPGRGGNPNFARPFPIRLPRSARGTNCFSRNSFIFKSIHIPGGVEQKRNQRGMGWRTIYSRAFALVGEHSCFGSKACC